MTLPSQVSPAVLMSRKGLKHLLIFVALWALLNKGDWSSWIVGIVVVPIAAWLSMTLFRTETVDDPIDTNGDVNGHTPLGASHISLLGLVLFIPFFLINSIRGGWQTAKMAIRPGLSAKPSIVQYWVRLPSGFPRLCFIHLISLLPGTLSVNREGDLLLMHVLDSDGFDMTEIAICEQKVANLFNISLVVEPKSVESTSGESA
jgi:multicomponent Na+:H+ antiporter subunit E